MSRRPRALRMCKLSTMVIWKCYWEGIKVVKTEMKRMMKILMLGCKMTMRTRTDLII